jgi:hypothetical protein
MSWEPSPYQQQQQQQPQSMGSHALGLQFPVPPPPFANTAHRAPPPTPQNYTGLQPFFHHPPYHYSYPHHEDARDLSSVESDDKFKHCFDSSLQTVKEVALESQKQTCSALKEIALESQNRITEIILKMSDNAETQSKRQDDMIKWQADMIHLLISKINIDGSGVAGPAATNTPMLSATASAAPAAGASFAFGGGTMHAANPGVSSTVAHSHGGSSATSAFAWGATGAGTDNGGSSAASTNSN